VAITKSVIGSFSQKKIIITRFGEQKPAAINDTLNLTFLTTIFGLTGEDGGFQRFTAVYDLTDSIELTGGIVFYQSGDLRRTMDIGDNDRVYFNVRYNF
jgi:hypothetical protein